MDARSLLNGDLVKSYDLRDGLRQLRRPVLMIHDHQDPIGDKTAEHIHGLIQTSVLLYLDRLGHFPWIEQPDMMRSIAADFLKSNF